MLNFLIFQFFYTLILYMIVYDILVSEKGKNLGLVMTLMMVCSGCLGRMPLKNLNKSQFVILMVMMGLKDVV